MFYKAVPVLRWTDILMRIDALLPSAAAALLTWILARKRLRISVA